MAVRYRVTFFDLLHELRRTLEVQAPSPEAAADKALLWHLDQDRFVSDFGPRVQIETVTTAKQSVALEAVARRVTGRHAQKRVA